eukprot:3588084-Prymnesium_polylepis.1
MPANQSQQLFDRGRLLFGDGVVDVHGDEAKHPKHPWYLQPPDVCNRGKTQKQRERQRRDERRHKRGWFKRPLANQGVVNN